MPYCGGGTSLCVGKRGTPLRISHPKFIISQHGPLEDRRTSENPTPVQMEVSTGKKGLLAYLVLMQVVRIQYGGTLYRILSSVVREGKGCCFYSSQFEPKLTVKKVHPRLGASLGARHMALALQYTRSLSMISPKPQNWQQMRVATVLLYSAYIQGVMRMRMRCVMG